MENGLGRAGYLMLAGVLFMLGAFGLAAAYLAYGEASATFFRLGLGVTAVALIGLLGFAAWAPWLAAAPAKSAADPVPAPEQSTPGPIGTTEPTGTMPTTSGPSSTQPAKRSIDFEFSDSEPAANAAPDDLVLPDAFQNRRPPAPAPSAARDPTAWPQRKGRSTGRNEWAAQIDRRRRVEEMVEDSPVRAEMQDRYTRTTPTVRSILQETKQAPMHIAERAPEDVGPGFAAPGMSVGQCGRCKTMVMAPDERPLRLKCPECAKVTSLA